MVRRLGDAVVLAPSLRRDLPPSADRLGGNVKLCDTPQIPKRIEELSTTNSAMLERFLVASAVFLVQFDDRVSLDVYCQLLLLHCLRNNAGITISVSNTSRCSHFRVAFQTIFDRATTSIAHPVDSTVPFPLISRNVPSESLHSILRSLERVHFSFGEHVEGRLLRRSPQPFDK